MLILNTCMLSSNSIIYIISSYLSECSCCNAHGALEAALLALLAVPKGWQSLAQEGCVGSTTPRVHPRHPTQEGANAGDNSVSYTVFAME